ncbi:3'-5' exonuclease-like [Tasmannia lanceolata]|uniref:3'-5' exonuclease-like n=1 Tax=Tasmannia lanceolata TaxID=3420 RepID=UPI0040629C6C
MVISLTTPPINCFGHEILTTVTYSGTSVRNWISEIKRINRRHLRHLIVGLDIEWRPNHQRNIQNPVAVLQLCVGDRCLIFQIMYATFIPHALEDFLSDPDFNFVGVGINDDADKLMNCYRLRVDYTTDLRYLAADETGRRELRGAGLKTLARDVLGFEVEKPEWIRRSSWDNRTLSYDQIQYACMDAFLSFEIGKSLITGEW